MKRRSVSTYRTTYTRNIVYVNTTTSKWNKEHNSLRTSAINACGHDNLCGFIELSEIRQTQQSYEL